MGFNSAFKGLSEVENWLLPLNVSSYRRDLIKVTNKMQLFRTIYYSIVPKLPNMCREILSLIIRSI